MCPVTNLTSYFQDECSMAVCLLSCYFCHLCHMSWVISLVHPTKLEMRPISHHYFIMSWGSWWSEKGSGRRNPILKLRLVFIPSTHDLPSNSRVKAHIIAMYFDLSGRISPLNTATPCSVKLDCSSSTESESFSRLVGYPLACLLLEHQPGVKCSYGTHSLSLCASRGSSCSGYKQLPVKRACFGFSLVVTGQVRSDIWNAPSEWVWGKICL